MKSLSSILKKKSVVFNALSVFLLLSAVQDSGFRHVSFAQEDEHAHEAGHDDNNAAHEDEDEGIHFDDETLVEFGVKTAQAAPGTIAKQVEAPGEVVLNPDTLAHIVPRIPGVVHEVLRSLGDFVKKKDLLAVLDSRELAILKSNYLATKERFNLAQINFDREQELWKKKISAEQDYLEAKQVLAEASINLKASEQQLHAVGFTEDSIAQLTSQSDDRLTRFEIRAPFEGRIIDKHLTLGEFVKDETAVFTIADLNTVWVNLTLYQNTLPEIQEGQSVEIAYNLGSASKEGVISYISPMLDETTRTAIARVIVENTGGTLRPGAFINGSIVIDRTPVSVYVPRSAIQTIDDKPVVFIRHEDGFEPREVQTGASDKQGVQIVSGLEPDETYVSEGGFALKAEMEKEAFAHSGHSH